MNNWLKYFTKEEIAGYKNAQNLYGKAYLICERVFENKKTKAGTPYMEHSLAVAQKFADEKMKVIALLHDIMKETEITPADLNYIGFPSDIVRTVTFITRQKDESYDEFINRIINSKNNKALQIKKADLEQSMDLTGFAHVSDDYLNRINIRYKPQYEKILDCLGDLEKES